MTIPDSFIQQEPMSYDEARHKIKPGDILLCAGTSFVSRAIQDMTKSHFSHCALLLPMPDGYQQQWLVLESIETIGVRCVPLKRGYLTDYMNSGTAYPGKLVIARRAGLAENHDALTNLTHLAYTLLGLRYSRHDIFRIASRILGHDFGNTDNDPIDSNGKSYICSEYVAACYQSAGYQIPHDRQGFLAPADIARAPNIKGIMCLQEIKEKAPAQQGV